jgi:hypothetical protein
VLTGQSVSKAAALGLGAFFGALYLGVALVLDAQAPRLFARLDLAFDADVPSRIIDLTRAGGAHYRTQVHPLFVLLLNPIGLLLRAVLRGVGTPDSGRIAAVLLTAVAGGGGVALFARLLGGFIPRAAAIAWTVVFGLSASQIVFGALPETFVFSGLALLAVAVVVGDVARPFPLRLAVAVACFGMAVSNLAAVALVRAEAVLRDGWRAALRSGLSLAALTVLATLPLAALQQALYPRSVAFYDVGRVARDDHLSFFRPESAGAAAARLVDLGAHLFFFNLAAPRLLVHGQGTQWPTVDFPSFSWPALRPAGAIHVVAFSATLALAAVGLWRSQRSLPAPALALLAWLGLHAILHSAFGLSLFLYSCHWTFAVVALAALGLDRWCAGARVRPLVAAGVPTALALLQLATNTALLSDLVSVFGPER